MENKITIAGACIFVIGVFCSVSSACWDPPPPSPCVICCDCSWEQCKVCCYCDPLEPTPPCDCPNDFKQCLDKCGDCEECDGSGHCIECGDIPNKSCCNGKCCDTTANCCVNGECKSKCIPHGGELCEYTFPSSPFECAIYNIDDPTCASEGTFCDWAVAGSPTNNDICQPGCDCERHSEACVSVYAKTCQTDLSIWYPFLDCYCKEPGGLVTEYPVGTRMVCGPPPF